MKDLQTYPVQVEYMVHWGDMDAARHVNNLTYLKWGESARLSYFEQMGMDVSFTAGSVGPILGWQDCKYLFPITYPDTALIGIKALEVKADRFYLECAIFSKRHERIAAISKQRIVAYDYSELKKANLPEEWVAAIQRIEGSSL